MQNIVGIFSLEFFLPELSCNIFDYQTLYVYLATGDMIYLVFFPLSYTVLPVYSKQICYLSLDKYRLVI